MSRWVVTFTGARYLPWLRGPGRDEGATPCDWIGSERSPSEPCPRAVSAPQFSSTSTSPSFKDPICPVTSASPTARINQRWPENRSPGPEMMWDMRRRDTERDGNASKEKKKKQHVSAVMSPVGYRGWCEVWWSSGEVLIWGSVSAGHDEQWWRRGQTPLPKNIHCYQRQSWAGEDQRQKLQ